MTNQIHFAQLQWHTRRGIKELDEILQGYLQQQYPFASPAEQQAFAKLLHYQDNEIMGRLFGGIEEQDPNILAVLKVLLRP